MNLEIIYFESDTRKVLKYNKETKNLDVSPFSVYTVNDGSGSCMK